jgi:hypothetical protein
MDKRLSVNLIRANELVREEFTTRMVHILKQSGWMIRQGLAIIIKRMEHADSSAISLSNPHPPFRKSALCFDKINLANIY